MFEFSGVMLVFEYEGKYDAYGQCVTCEYEPCCGPVGDVVGGEVVYYPAACIASDDGSQPVGHNHEEPLGACPDGGGGFFLDKQGA